MFYADTRGLYDVARRMRAFAARNEVDREFWTPSPRIERMANEGGTFNP